MACKEPIFLGEDQYLRGYDNFKFPFFLDSGICIRFLAYKSR